MQVLLPVSKVGFIVRVLQSSICENNTSSALCFVHILGCALQSAK